QRLTTQTQLAMKRLVIALLIEMWPYKSFFYLERFAQTLHQTNIGENRRVIRLIRLIICFKLTLALREIVLGVFPWRPIDRIQLFDTMYLFRMGRENNLMVALIYLMVALIYWL